MSEQTILYFLASILGGAFTLLGIKLSGIVKHEVEDALQKQQHEFEKFINQIERVDRYELVAIERRLAAHQELFAIARDMNYFLWGSSEQQVTVMRAVEEFKDKNAIYLKEPLMTALNEAASAFRELDLLQKSKERASDSQRGLIMDKMQEAHKKLIELPELIRNSFRFEPASLERPVETSKERLSE
jgi:hypothetical protein